MEQNWKQTVDHILSNELKQEYKKWANTALSNNVLQIPVHQIN
jgi:hypothetical protein